MHINQWSCHRLYIYHQIDCSQLQPTVDDETASSKCSSSSSYIELELHQRWCKWAVWLHRLLCPYSYCWLHIELWVQSKSQLWISITCTFVSNSRVLSELNSSTRWWPQRRRHSVMGDLRIDQLHPRLLARPVLALRVQQRRSILHSRVYDGPVQTWLHRILIFENWCTYTIRPAIQISRVWKRIQLSGFLPGEHGGFSSRLQAVGVLYLWWCSRTECFGWYGCHSSADVRSLWGSLQGVRLSRTWALAVGGLHRPDDARELCRRVRSVQCSCRGRWEMHVLWSNCESGFLCTIQIWLLWESHWCQHKRPI